MSRILRSDLPGPRLFSVDVVGERYYQNNIRELLSTVPDADAFRSSHEFVATIVSEPTNPHDPYAIKVAIDGRTVGHLSAQMARRLHEQLRRKGFTQIEARCQAIVVGGFIESVGEELFGVKLDIYTHGQRASEREFAGTTELNFSVDHDFHEQVEDFEFLFVGNVVNFWKNPLSPDLINVYCAGTIGGSGKLGRVPTRFVYPISKFLTDGNEYRAEITRVGPASSEICCKITPLEVTLARREEEKRQWIKRVQESLRKPYHPVKPIDFRISNADRDLKKGDELQLLSLPTIDAMLVYESRVDVVFQCIRTKQVFSESLEHSFVQRLVRLKNTDDITFKIRITTPMRYRREITHYNVSIETSKLSSQPRTSRESRQAANKPMHPSGGSAAS